MSDWPAQRRAFHRTAALSQSVPACSTLAAIVPHRRCKGSPKYYDPNDPAAGLTKIPQTGWSCMAPDWPESPAAVAPARLLQQGGGPAFGGQAAAELFASLRSRRIPRQTERCGTCWPARGFQVRTGATPHHHVAATCGKVARRPWASMTAAQPTVASRELFGVPGVVR